MIYLAAKPFGGISKEEAMMYEEVLAGALKNTERVLWDGCHKIYLIPKGGDHLTNGAEIGYQSFEVADWEFPAEEVWRMYHNSCGLRFITVLDGAKFSQVVPQVRPAIEHAVPDADSAGAVVDEVMRLIQTSSDELTDHECLEKVYDLLGEYFKRFM